MKILYFIWWGYLEGNFNGENTFKLVFQMMALINEYIRFSILKALPILRASYQGWWLQILR